MALWLARQKREQDVADQSASKARARRDLVRLYADPLREATKSLIFRLQEITTTGQARYLLANTAKTPFVEYKRISTLYRVAALLGWIRAMRRERSYLDPEDLQPIDPKSDPVGAIERALADGQHVEQQRLDELLNLWRVPKRDFDDTVWRRLATDLDGIRQEFLSAKGSLVAAELQDDEKKELALRCATLISERISVDIPEGLTAGSAEQTSAFLGIKEAYIYRDWQVALGDMMIREVSGAPRRYEIIGYGEFENRYVRAQDSKEAPDRRWFDRLETLFRDLDMAKTGMFDARREQIQRLSGACADLERFLSCKISELSPAVK